MERRKKGTFVFAAEYFFVRCKRRSIFAVTGGNFSHECTPVLYVCMYRYVCTEASERERTCRSRSSHCFRIGCKTKNEPNCLLVTSFHPLGGSNQIRPLIANASSAVNEEEKSEDIPIDPVTVAQAAVVYEEVAAENKKLMEEEKAPERTENEEEKEILRRQMKDATIRAEKQKLKMMEEGQARERRQMEKAMIRTEEKKRRNKRRMYIFIFVVVVIIAGFGAYFGTRGSSTDNAEGETTPSIADQGDSPTAAAPAPTPEPTASPTSRCSMLEAILVDHDPLHVDAKNWLCDTDSWVPPANDFDPDRLWNERYAMTVFYYSTIGNGWDNDDGWLSSTSVCVWSMSVDPPCGGSDSRVTDINVGESRLSLFPAVAQLQQVCNLT
jgi:hypothetical protein